MIKKILVVIFTIIIAWALISVICAQAQEWAAMPPYNLLWPLWSEVYSPPDPITGIPTPLLNQVTSSSILPVQPIYLWNPYGYEFPMGFIQPWLLYNSPMGVLYYDTVFGLNPFPPSGLLDPLSGLPSPIALPLNYTSLAIPSLGLALYTFELGNASYLTAFGNNLGINPASLLTYYDVYGTPDVLVSTSW